MLAAYNSHKQIISLLIKNQIDINAKNIYQKTAILYAAHGGSKKTFELLLKNGANINDSDKLQTTCLHFASGRIPEKNNLVKLILDKCNNKNQKDIKNKNALDYAIEYRATKTVKLLKEAGLQETPNNEIDEDAVKNKTKLVKISECFSCGASKKTISKTAWIYCDHCASCIDWDYKKAKEVKASPEKQELYTKNYSERMNNIILAAEKGNFVEWEKLIIENTELEIDAYPN